MHGVASPGPPTEPLNLRRTSHDPASISDETRGLDRAEFMLGQNLE